MKTEFLGHPSIAVIGISHAPYKLGRMILQQLRRYGYPGHVVGINPRVESGHSFEGYPIFSSVSAVGMPIDLVLVAVPRSAVRDAIIDCGYAGVPQAIVFSSGYADAGKDGQDMEESLIELAAQYHLEIIGPNAAGYIRPEQSLAATPIPFHEPIPAGQVALISQSGAISAMLLDWLQREGLGCSFWLGLGNGAMVGPSEALAMARTDKATKAVAVVLTHPAPLEPFLAQARLITPTKPLVVLAPTQATNEREHILDAGLHQVGAYRATTLDEFYQAVRALSLPFRKAHRPVMISHSHGLAELEIDTMKKHGAPLAPLPAVLQHRLAAVLPAACTIGNPINILDDADLSRYEMVLHELLTTEADPVIIVARPSSEEAPRFASALTKWARASGKRLIVCANDYFAREAETWRKADIIFCQTPERAGHLAGWLGAAHKNARQPTSPPRIPVKDMQSLRKVFQQRDITSRSRHRLDWPLLRTITLVSDFHPVEGKVCQTITQIQRAVRLFGWPIRVRSLEGQFGVLDIAARQLADIPARYKNAPLLVEKLEVSAIDLRLHTTRTEDGLIIYLSLSGIYKDMGEPVYGVAPLSKEDAQAMLQQLGLPERGHNQPMHEQLCAGITKVAGLAQAFEGCAELTLDLAIGHHDIRITNAQAVSA